MGKLSVIANLLLAPIAACSITYGVATTNVLEKTKQENEDLNQTNITIQAENTELKTSLADYIAEQEELQENLRTSQEALDLANTRISQIESELETKKTRLTQVEDELLVSNSNNEILLQEKLQLETDISILNNEKASLRTQITSLSATINALKTKVSNLQNELYDFKATDASLFKFNAGMLTGYTGTLDKIIVPSSYENKLASTRSVMFNTAEELKVYCSTNEVNYPVGIMLSNVEGAGYLSAESFDELSNSIDDRYAPFTVNFTEYTTFTQEIQIIGGNAFVQGFHENSLNHIVLPNTVTTIEEYAFKDANIAYENGIYNSTLTLPKSVTYIDPNSCIDGFTTIYYEGTRKEFETLCMNSNYYDYYRLNVVYETYEI